MLVFDSAEMMDQAMAAAMHFLQPFMPVLVAVVGLMLVGLVVSMVKR